MSIVLQSSTSRKKDIIYCSVGIEWELVWIWIDGMDNSQVLYLVALTSVAWILDFEFNSDSASSEIPGLLLGQNQ
jgi:hypothetical protein